MGPFWHWWAIFIGVRNGDSNQTGYLFWSGIGGDLAYLSFLWAGVVLYRKHQCHVKGCPRLARFPVPGTPWTVCSRHHPSDPPTHGEVLASQERTP